MSARPRRSSWESPWSSAGSPWPRSRSPGSVTPCARAATWRLPPGRLAAMDESATDVATSPPAPDDPLRPYRSWATVVFMILVLTGLLGIAVVVAAAQGAGTRVILVAASTAVLGVVVFAVAAFGLDRRAPWAVRAVQPICVVLIVSG